MAYNRSEAAMDELNNEGAKIATSSNKAAANADIVFSMLSRPEAIESVFVGDDGCLKSRKEKTFLVDCSTVNPSLSSKTD